MIRPGAIGDCITSLPALQFLRADYTEIWVPTALVPLITCADRVRSIMDTGLNLVALHQTEMPEQVALALRGFDHIVSWYGSNRPLFRLALESTGMPCTFLQALPPSGCNMAATDFFCQQVNAPYGLAPQIAVRAPRRRDTIVIHPFSGSARKNWPLSSFRALAGRVPLPVEWIAGPEEHLPEAICFPDLKELADWISGAACYVGNDSGISHLAAAVNVPTVALFGPSDSKVWAPRGRQVRVLEGGARMEICVESVVSAIQTLLRNP